MLGETISLSDRVYSRRSSQQELILQDLPLPAMPERSNLLDKDEFYLFVEGLQQHQRALEEKKVSLTQCREEVGVKIKGLSRRTSLSQLFKPTTAEDLAFRELVQGMKVGLENAVNLLESIRDDLDLIANLLAKVDIAGVKIEEVMSNIHRAYHECHDEKLKQLFSQGYYCLRLIKQAVEGAEKYKLVFHPDHSMAVAILCDDQPSLAAGP